MEFLKQINGLTSTTITKALEESKHSWEDEKQDVNTEEILNVTKDLNFIVSFGRGFWSGIKHMQYTLVYKQSTNEYLWIYDAGGDEDERLSVYRMPSNARFFSKVEELTSNNLYDTFDSYFNSDAYFFDSLKHVPLTELGFKRMNNEELSLIWYELTSPLRNSPKELLRFVNHQKFLKKEKKASQFVDHYKHELDTLILVEGKPHLLMKDGTSYPIVLG